jgi:hypothetical protein
MAEGGKSDRVPGYLSELHEIFKTKTSNVDSQERKTMSDLSAENNKAIALEGIRYPVR